MKESLLKGINLDAARAALQAAPDGSNTNLVALYLSLDNIEPDPNQPRRSLEAGEGDQSLEELADSILQHGVLQPITVEANGQGKYRIVAGERRWRAAMIARDRGEPCARKDYNLQRIPAVITHSENPADRLEMQLVENLARADMRDTDIAAALQSLLDTLQISKAELARRIGRDRSWVSRILAKADPAASELAIRIGVSLEDLGILELQRLLSWQGDPEKSHWIAAVAEAIQEGAPFSRALLNAIEQREQHPEPNPATVTGNTAVAVPLPAGDTAVPPPGMADVPPMADSQSHTAPGNGEEKIWDTDGDSTEHTATVAASRYGRSAAEDGDEEEPQSKGSCTDRADSEGPPERQAPAVRNPLAAMPEQEQVNVTLPRTLVEQLLKKAGIELRGTLGPEEIIAALEAILKEGRERDLSRRMLR